MARDEHTPGTDAKQFEKEGAARNAILVMNRKVEELNDLISATIRDGYNVEMKVKFTAEDTPQLAVAILLPDGVENIRG